MVERAHGKFDVRGSGSVPHSSLYQGRFGRLFRTLPSLHPPLEALEELATKMS